MDAFSQSLPQPPELLNVLNGESQDFAVKAQKSCPVSQAVTLIIFGLFWSGMLSFFLVGILGPFIQGQPIHYKSNGVMVTVPPGHLGPMIVPLIIVGVFSLIGIAMLAGGFNMLFAPGPWFVGTPTRLVVWSPKSLQTINWGDFDGAMNVTGGPDNGTITIEKCSGRMVSSNNGPSRYVPDKLYIVGIPNAMAIEEMCRKRINDHTKNS